MRALKLKAQVTRDHSLHLQLPEDVQEGPAEVIVLISGGEAADRPAAGSLADFLAAPPIDPRLSRTKEAIDRSLQEERRAWE